MMAENAGATPEAAEQKEGGIIDQRYYRGLLAIPKGVEVICSLIAYICVELESCGAGATGGFFKFVSITAFVTTLILWVLLLLKVPQRILRCDCVNWPFVELCYYVGVIIFYFFGDLFLAIQQCGGGHQAGAAFGFFALFAYIADAGWTGITWWRARKETRSAAMQAENAASPEPRY